MLIAVTSDVHGNRHAFGAVIGAADAAGADQLWCLGDLVGYGAEPDACVELADSNATVSLAGNHDLGVLGTIPVEEFSASARVAAEWTQEVIAPDTRDYLSTLRPATGTNGYGLFHASPRDPTWEYVIDPVTAELCLDAVKQPINLIGHSHVALTFSRADGGPTSGAQRRDGESVELEDGAWLLNPGAVGQPRDGDPRAAWMLLDTDRQRATWRRTEYDIAAAAQAILAAGLPEPLAERLHYGQ